MKQIFHWPDGCVNSVLITTVLAVLLAACGEPANRGTAGFVTLVDTAGGTVHVRHSGTAPAWRAESVLRLGSMDAGPEEFGRIRSLIADGAGNLYIADNLAQEIRVFAPDGRHLRTIGRSGSGPGEFRDLYSLAWLDGNLAAMDPRNARIAILSPDGEWLDGIQHYPISGPPSLIRLHPLGSNGFYAPIVDDGRQSIPFVRLTIDGPRDTIEYPRGAESVRRSGVVCRRSDGGITAISPTQAPAVVYGFPPPGGAVAVSWGDSYRIALVTPHGDTSRTVTREGPPLPYPDELWEEAVRPYNELHEKFPGSRCEPSALERPRYRAALRHILFDEEGQMWVEAASEDGFVWEVFDAEGRLLGAAPAPERFAEIPPYVRDGLLYQVEIDELDVQRVAVYRISPQS